MTVGVPETSNFSWRVKYDKVEKDAVTGQQSQKPADDFKEHKPEPPKMGGRKEFGKPAKAPAKPKAGNVPRLTGGKLQGLSDRVQQLRTQQEMRRTAGNIPRPQDTSRKTPMGQTQSDKKIKPEFEKRRESMRNTDRIMGKLRRQAQEHPRSEVGAIQDPDTKERRMRDAKRGRHQRGKITPKPLKTTPQDVLEKEPQTGERDETPKFGRDRGMPHPDKIPSSDDSMIQTTNPKRDQSSPNKKGKRPTSSSRQTRGITSTQAGDKTTQQSRMKKPVQTSGQTAFRSRTIEDQALGRKDTDIEPSEEEKEKQRREAQSRSDRGIKEDDKPKTPKEIEVKRPEQAGTQHSFTKLTEKPTGQREKRPEQGVEGRQQLGSKEMQDRKGKKIKDPKTGEEYPEKEQSKTRFGAHFSQERESRVSGKEGKYNKLVEELRQAKQEKQDAKTDAKVKELNEKIRDLKSQVKRPKEEVDAEDKEEKKPLPKGVPERAVVKPDEVVEDVGQPAKPKVEGKVRTGNDVDVGDPKRDTTGHGKELMPKNPPKQRSGNMSYAHPPTKFERDTGKKDKDGNPIKETTNVPESLVHEKVVGGKRQFVLSGKDPETGITAKEVFDSTGGMGTTSNMTEYDKERRRQRSDDPSEAPKSKVIRTHSKYTLDQLKEWLKDNNQTVDMNDKVAVDAKVRQMRRSTKSLIDMNTQYLKLLQLKSNL